MEGHMTPVSLVKKSFLNPSESQGLTIGQEIQGTEQDEKHHRLSSESPLRGTQTKTLETDASADFPAAWLLLPSQEPIQVTTQVTVLAPLTNCDHRQAARSLGSSAPLFLTQDKKGTTSKAG